MSYRLYSPGPLTVSDSIVQAMGKPMIGHRSGDFVKLYNDMQPRLQAMFFTQDPVYLATSSVNLEVTMKYWPGVHFHATREHGQRLAHEDR